MKNFTRREIIKTGIVTGAIAAASGPFPRKAAAHAFKGAEDPGLEKTVAVVKGGSPGKMAKAAVKALGGMKKFVSKNDVVVVKPNIAWDCAPELAGNTNPEVVAAVIEDCLAAGAKKVLVFDNTCNNARRTYVTTGIKAAAVKAGADVSHIDHSKWRKIKIPKGEQLKECLVYGPLLDADKFINVPIAKHHGIATVTMSFKNLMGIIRNRSEMHRGIHQKLVDLATVVKPDLNVLDAYRVLIKRGPRGGKPEFVRKAGVVVAGVNMVAVDAWGVKILSQYEGWKGKKPEDMPFIKNAYDRKLGEMRLDKLKIINRKV